MPSEPDCRGGGKAERGRSAKRRRNAPLCPARDLARGTTTSPLTTGQSPVGGHLTRTTHVLAPPPCDALTTTLADTPVSLALARRLRRLERTFAEPALVSHATFGVAICGPRTTRSLPERFSRGKPQRSARVGNIFCYSAILGGAFSEALFLGFRAFRGSSALAARACRQLDIPE